MEAQMKSLLMLVFPLALAAQNAPAPQPATPAPAPAPQARNAADSSILKSLSLPQTVQRQRERGAADSTVRAALERMRNAGVPADVAQAAVEDDERVRSEGRPEGDSFGAFVRAQVESGKRGRELADALKAEKERRGIGRADRGGRPDAARGGRPDGARGGRPDSGRAGNRPAQPGRDTSRTTKAPSNPRRP
jgi:hypothetical protein